jgi:hypothetical protein
MATESSGMVESSSTIPLRSALLTFLIADVRGYTSFTVEQGNEAAARLASTFAAIARAVVAARDAEVIELRGDEALAVFPSARHALYAAVELQARFREHMEVDPAKPRQKLIDASVHYLWPNNFVRQGRVDYGVVNRGMARGAYQSTIRSCCNRADCAASASERSD